MGQKSDALAGGGPVRRDDLPTETEPGDQYGAGETLDDDLAVPGLYTPGLGTGPVAEGQPYSEGDPELFTAETAAGVPVDDVGRGDSREDDDIEETRARIEHTRSQMSETIDAIQEKLSPQHIAQEAKDTVREATVGKAQEMVGNAGDTARGFGSTLLDTVRQNPVPAALAGLGLGWLLVSGRKQSDDSSGYRSGYRSPYGYPDEYRYGSGSFDNAGDSAPGTRLGQAQDRVGNLAQGAQGTARNAAGQVSETADQVTGQLQDKAGQVQETAGQLVNRAQYGAQQATGTFQRMVESNPLAVGAMAVAMGAAIGLSIPETPKENELLGETRDQVVKQAQQTMQDKAQKVQSVAQETVGAAREAAQNAANEQGLTQ